MAKNLVLNLELRTDNLLQFLYVRSLHNPQQTMCMKQCSFLFLHTLHYSLVWPKDVQLIDLFQETFHLPLKHRHQHVLRISRQVLSTSASTSSKFKTIPPLTPPELSLCFDIILAITVGLSLISMPDSNLSCFHVCPQEYISKRMVPTWKRPIVVAFLSVSAQVQSEEVGENGHHSQRVIGSRRPSRHSEFNEQRL